MFMTIFYYILLQPVKTYFFSHVTWTHNASCRVMKDIVWLVRKQEYVFPSPYGLAFRHPVNVRTAKTNYILDLKNKLKRAQYLTKNIILQKYHFTAIKCPRLRRPNYGEIYPSDCTNSRMPFEGRCAFSCHAGFQLQGPSLRQCVSPGRWNGGNLMTRCVGKNLGFAFV